MASVIEGVGTYIYLIYMFPLTPKGVIERNFMKYIGHGVVYYMGAHGYRVGISDDNTFYTVNFDAGFPLIRILIGKQNCISGSMFRLLMDDDPDVVDDPYRFNPDDLIDLLIEDLKARFDIKVRLII